jgi:hypothetical protein
MGKTHGFALRPPAQDTPVTFHPENIQLGAAVAVTFTTRPTSSEHPDGQDGLTEPSPTIAVVSEAEGGAHVPCTQPIVTMRVGARRTRLPYVPVTVI